MSQHEAATEEQVQEPSQEKSLEQVMADKEAEKRRKDELKAEQKAKKDQEKADAKAKKAQEKADAKAAKEVLKSQEGEAPASKVKDQKNGVTRPGSGVTLQVWVKADELSKKLEAPVDRATLTEVLRGIIEVGTIHTQYGRWRKYYGLSETREERRVRLESVRNAKEAAKAEEKAMKDQEKADQLKAAQAQQSSEVPAA
jgi:hypothetical protein